MVREALREVSHQGVRPSRLWVKRETLRKALRQVGRVAPGTSSCLDFRLPDLNGVEVTARPSGRRKPCEGSRIVRIFRTSVSLPPCCEQGPAAVCIKVRLRVPSWWGRSVR